MTAILYALEIDHLRPRVVDLIEAFAPYMERSGHWQTWARGLAQALDSTPAQDLTSTISLLSLSARLAQRRGHYPAAIPAYRRAIRLARRIGDRFNEARACSNLGFLFIAKQRWHRAEVLCCHALKIFEALDSDHGLAHTENHLGVLYTRRGMRKKARQHLEGACTVWASMGDDYGLMQGYVNLGTLYEQKQPDKAVIYLKKALDQAEKVRDEFELGIAHLNIGVALKQSGNLAKAEAHTLEAEAVFRRYSHLPERTNALENLGEIYISQGKWSDAIVHLENALTIRKSLKTDQKSELQALIYLAQCEAAQGNFQGVLDRIQEADNLLLNLGQDGNAQHFVQQLKQVSRSIDNLIADNTPAMTA